VQQQILETHPAARLRVYAVWFSMLVGDSRSAWHSGAMSDSRVTNLWDEQHIVSEWFTKNVAGGGGGGGNIWDAYFLYGPQATWASDTTAPGPLVDSGGTVISKLESLEASVTPLLGR
jgi:hypothetical protein